LMTQCASLSTLLAEKNSCASAGMLTILRFNRTANPVVEVGVVVGDLREDRGEIYEKQLLELRPLIGGGPLREVYLGVVGEEVEEVLAAVDFF
jgi:hypothetical protein